MHQDKKNHDHIQDHVNIKGSRRIQNITYSNRSDPVRSSVGRTLSEHSKGRRFNIRPVLIHTQYNTINNI